jgi:phage-related protein
MISLEYDIVYYKKTNGTEPVREYVAALPEKERLRVKKYLDHLLASNGYLDEPYSRKVFGTAYRELRVDFSRARHRIFYFTFVGKKIVLLHAFLKDTRKTPPREIAKGNAAYEEFLRRN